MPRAVNLPDMNWSSPLLAFATLTMVASARPYAPDEILSAVQTRLESGQDLTELITILDDLPSADLDKIEQDVDKAWDHIHRSYLSAFEAKAGGLNSGQLRQENQKRLRDLRTQFHNVRRMPEAAMKDALKKISRPAMDELLALLLPTASNILESGGPELKKQREFALGLAKFRNGIRAANVASGEENSLEVIGGGEEEIAKKLSGLDRNGLRIMADNRKLAASADLPEEERMGIEELNTMRLLVELPALRIDPKLCDAARDHSQDMNTLGFFSHTSPVAGKSTPSARAARAGTSGGGENIYMGSKNPKSANKGWFYSPGHHKNMFKAGYRRVGLGNYGVHWTQMFGS